MVAEAPQQRLCRVLRLVAGSDYVAAFNADFFLAAGQLTKTFAISIEGDTTPEANERFRVALSLQGDASVNVSDAQAWGTIANDDFIVPILVGPAVVNGRVGKMLPSAWWWRILPLRSH